jgi:beta-mannosidase
MSDSQNRLSLNGTWQLSYGQQSSSDIPSLNAVQKSLENLINAEVPGNVELDLQRQGLLPSLEEGDQIYEVLKWEKHWWCYQKDVEIPKVESNQKIFLVFEGIDCFAQIYLNETLIGETNNMFVSHEFDVSPFSQSRRHHTLTVIIGSAVLAGERHQPGPSEWTLPGKTESLSVRKASHMYGWDIMPRIVSAGLWKDVFIETRNYPRITSSYWATKNLTKDHSMCELHVQWELEDFEETLTSTTLELELHDASGKVVCTESLIKPAQTGSITLAIDNPKLWWPFGYGEPVRYEAIVRVRETSSGSILDQSSQSIGIREIILETSDYSDGKEVPPFSFTVNGLAIFARGTNWVPLDASHSRDSEHLEKTFQMLVELQCNMVRCWGGNVYESDTFYELCDQHGILVWQDFSFACASYPQNDAFLGQIEREAKSISKRLRNHPSIAIWSGNNENDLVPWMEGQAFNPNDDQISRNILPSVIKETDPYRSYLPSSPYIGPEMLKHLEKNIHRLPENHLWGPRGWFKDSFYRNDECHFVSEIGYHGCPSKESLEKMLGAENVWPWENNPIWWAKAVCFIPEDKDNRWRINLMANQIKHHFGVIPDNLDDFVYASQATQAEALKFFIEWFRQRKGYTTGILWWNLRDGWPIISDAIVDYYYNRKSAFEYVKRVQQSQCLFLSEPEDNKQKIIGVNDTQEVFEGVYSVHDLLSKEVLSKGHFSISKNGHCKLAPINKTETHGLYVIRWESKGTTYHNHYITGSHPFPLNEYRKWMEEFTSLT